MNKSSQLRTLANLAKQRMKMGNYKEITTMPKSSIIPAVSASTYFMCNARALKREYIKAEIVSIDTKDSEFEQKVISLLNSDNMLLNTLGMLADPNKINNMNDMQKQLYMLELSEKYNKVKDQYYKSA